MWQGQNLFQHQGNESTVTNRPPHQTPDGPPIGYGGIEVVLDSSSFGIMQEKFAPLLEAILVLASEVQPSQNRRPHVHQALAHIVTDVVQQEAAGVFRI